MSSPVEQNEKEASSASTSSSADVTVPTASKSTHVPRSSYASATRPNTASSTFSDPFASPESSRPPSIRPPLSPSSSHISFPQGLGLGGATNHVPRSVLNSSASRDSNLLGSPTAYGFSSARSSAARMSSATNSNSVYGVVPNSVSVLRHKAPRMKSHMLKEGEEVPKPWTEKKNPRAAISYWMVWFVFFLGVGGGAFQCYVQYKGVRIDKQPLCMVLDEQFDNPDKVFGEGGTFYREVSMDGFGNGQFEMTTASQNNSFVKDGKLYIVPTLTSDNIGSNAVFDQTVYNITGCTFNKTRPDNGFVLRQGERVFDVDGYVKACSRVSNATSGVVINPVQSARLSTIKSASIRYGRVEVRAKLPHGDWLWPAIWMLPKDNKYGVWPMSGEIDIMESRGNGLRYTAHGSNYVQGSLHWGPAPTLNGNPKTYSWWSNKRESFADKFHTYTLEWTDKWLRISVDSRLHTLLDLRFNKPFFDRGDFPPIISNGSSLVPLPNPWADGSNATPFDQDFYLILNVAVGGTNGWFPEAQGDKPWLDAAANPAHDFIKAIDKWYPTWPPTVEDRAMVVDYVKMWKHC
ncbi:glucan 1,3-beta-glucosidase [Ephemerocybe angulata]|uniref:Glucan 1,3-beta-glucosidase n=1 Tax=Ephemerocybe angulata TaxID=980116 RepID=A0A8H6MFR0_9AGAR|nr:glucan 1,3-beta-glucosidase [Tulosesus angulatus]